MKKSTKLEQYRVSMTRKNFQAFPPSSKKIILEWILNTKKPETG
jgi:hypothetical protein